MGLTVRPKSPGVCTQEHFVNWHHFQLVLCRSDANSQNDPSDTLRNFSSKKVLPFCGVAQNQRRRSSVSLSPSYTQLQQCVFIPLFPSRALCCRTTVVVRNKCGGVAWFNL